MLPKGNFGIKGLSVYWNISAEDDCLNWCAKGFTDTHFAGTISCMIRGSNCKSVLNTPLCRAGQRGSDCRSVFHTPLCGAGQGGSHCRFVLHTPLCGAGQGGSQLKFSHC